MVVCLYRVLLIPSQDYARHPHITRHHHLFENFDDRFKVTVLNVRLRVGPTTRETKHEVVEVGLPTNRILRSYVLAYATFHLKLARLVKSERYDCVILSNVISPLIPLLVSGRPLIFDYKDVYSLSASAPFVSPTKPLVQWAARLFEQILFKFPMTVVVPSPSMQRLVRDRFKTDSILIPNGVNTALFHPISEGERRQVRSELELIQGEFGLCYLGSIENWLDLETVVQALVTLDSLKLILIGGPPRSASYLDYILDLCEKKKVRDRVILTGFKPQAEAAKIVASCDAAIIPFSLQSELSAVALPDKAFEYLACGVPVISTRIPDVEELFHDCVYFYDTKEDLTRILKDLLTHSERKCTPAKQIAKAIAYDWKLLSETYERLIVRLVRDQAKEQ